MDSPWTRIGSLWLRFSIHNHNMCWNSFHIHSVINRVSNLYIIDGTNFLKVFVIKGDMEGYSKDTISTAC